jgi:hypothetical protein
MRRPFAAVAVLGTATAVLALAGCGSSTSPKQTNFKSLDAGTQAVVEQEAVTEVEANVSSFASFDPYAGFGFSRVAPFRGNGAIKMMGARGAHAPRFQSTDCSPAVSGDQTDADQDNIPANATATFSCTFTGGSETGTLSFSDPTPSTADLEYSANADLTINESGGSNGDLALTLSGTAALTQAPGTLTETGNSSLNAAITNAPNNQNGTVKFKANGTATYTYSGGTLVAFGDLPDGQFDLTGDWSYDVASPSLTINLSFHVTTPGGLQIKQACTSNFGHIDSGEIDIKFSDGTLVKAQYSGCPAQPSYTIS